MRWKVRGQRTLYRSDWVNVEVADVELPDGRRLDHHVLRMHRQSASAAVIDDQGRVLMLWRHRFITDRWGWELPCGWVNPGEDPAEATRREVLEETGWEVEPAALLGVYEFEPPELGYGFLRFAYLARPLRHHADRKLDPGIARALWLTPDELRAERKRHRSPMVQRCVDDALAVVRWPSLPRYREIYDAASER